MILKRESKRFNCWSIIVPVAILVITALLVNISIHFIYGNFTNLFHYPEEEYKALESEIQNIVVDNQYIEMNKLSDDCIEYSVTYLSNNTIKILLEKADYEITAELNRTTADNSLKIVEIVRNQTSFGFGVCSCISFGLILVLSLILSIIILIIIFCIVFSIQVIIEDAIEKRREKKKTVSNSKR